MWKCGIVSQWESLQKAFPLYVRLALIYYLRVAARMLATSNSLVAVIQPTEKILLRLDRNINQLCDKW